MAFCKYFMNAQIICDGKKVILTEDGACNYASYHLIFDENFSGTALDTSKWIASAGVLRDISHTYSQQWYSPQNITISDGTMKLTAKPEILLNQCYTIWEINKMNTYCEDFFYTAGEIRTKEKYSHGIFEISCKFPKGKGLGMAFWTYGYDGENEIDVFEYENEKNIFNQYDKSKLSRVHRMNSRTDYEKDGKIEDCSTHYKGDDMSDGFHTFSVVWTPHKLEWFVDGKLKRVSTLFYTMLGQTVECEGLMAGTEYILNRAFPRNPMEIYISLGVFSNKNAPDNSTEFPAVFEIDYMRYYSK